MGTLEAQLAAWAAGIADELRFWREWMETGGLSWPADFHDRLDPGTAFNGRLAEILRGLSWPEADAAPRTARVLDVGAGPVTSLGYALPGWQLDLQAVDPLAHFYTALLDRHGLRPPVPTRFGVAEDLTAFLPPGSFDLVHCRNALDHSFDPLRGIEEMLAVLRVGGVALLSHLPNEAVTENYAGMHQYNFELEEGRFIIWTPAARVDVQAALRCPCRITVQPGHFIEVLIEKTGEAPADPAACRSRLAGYLEAFVRVIGVQPGLAAKDTV